MTPVSAKHFLVIAVGYWLYKVVPVIAVQHRGIALSALASSVMTKCIMVDLLHLVPCDQCLASTGRQLKQRL